MPKVLCKGCQKETKALVNVEEFHSIHSDHRGKLCLDCVLKLIEQMSPDKWSMRPYLYVPPGDLARFLEGRNG